MKEKNLKIQIGIILGLGFLLIVGMVAGFSMLLIKPENEKLAGSLAKLQALKTEAEPLAKNKLLLAEAEVQEVHLNAQLEFFRNRYRAFNYGPWDPAKPDTDKENKAYKETVWQDLMKEFSYEYGQRLESEIYGAAVRSGVEITKLDKIQIQDPPQMPEQLAMPSSGFFKPTGPEPLDMEIVGTLDQVLSFFENIHKGTILTTVGPSLKLQGSAFKVIATFSIQPYLVAKGKSLKLSGTAPAVAAPGAPAAGAPGAPPSPPVQ